MAENFSEFGFFNGVWKYNQENWPKYFFDNIPDGVIKNIGNELQVYANSTGMVVSVKTGACMVRTHRGMNLLTETELPIEAADATYGRVDLVVARAVYAVAPNSYMCLDVLKGAPSSSPVAPILTQTAGVLWEIPLAEVYIGAGAVTITAGNVTDKRSFSVLPIRMGGTGGATPQEALANIIGGSALPIVNGGTGADDVAEARGNLGVTALFNATSGHDHDGIDSKKVDGANLAGIVPVAHGGIGADNAAGGRTNLGLGSVATKATGSAEVGFSFGAAGDLGVGVSGLPAAGLVWIEPREDSRAAFYAADVRYLSHSAGWLTLRATSNPGWIAVVVGWIG